MDRPDTDQTLTADNLSQRPAAALALHVLTGHTHRRWIRLRGPQLTFGRQPSGGEAVSFDDPKMSRDHARLQRTAPGVYTLSDCGSKNGTFCNGEPAQGTVLAHQDVIRLGDTVLVVTTDAPRAPDDGSPLTGQSQRMEQLRQQLRRTALSGLSVLFLGETGTGKGVCAHRVHEELSGRSGEFVSINCAAIPSQLIERELFGHSRGAYTGADRSAPGYIRSADGGTLFLDEIGELSLEAQAKLLSFLDDHSYRAVGSTVLCHADVRILAATNRDLEASVRHNRFRADLLARLEQMVITLPPLRARREDLMLLAHAVMDRHLGRRYRCSADAIEAIAIYDWPRNVRELSTLLQRAPYSRDTVEQIELADLPEGLQAPLLSPFRRATTGTGAAASPTHEALVALLKSHPGNISHIGEALGRDRRQIYRWMQQMGLDPNRFRK